VDRSRNPLTNMPMKGVVEPEEPGCRWIMVEARGPGHLALSDRQSRGRDRGAAMQHGQQIWGPSEQPVPGATTATFKYDWYPSDVWYETGQDSDDREMPTTSMGQYGRRVRRAGSPGLLLLHAPGNVFNPRSPAGRDHADPPSSLLYRDVTVRMAPAPGVSRLTVTSWWVVAYECADGLGVLRAARKTD